MKKVIVAITLVLAIGLVLNSCKEKKTSEEEKHVEETVITDEKEHDALASHDSFQCPMKCEKEKTYEAKGDCPVCKMELKKLALKEESGSEHSEEEEHDEGDHHE